MKEQEFYNNYTPEFLTNVVIILGINNVIQPKG
jgi:hypothetical protein